MITPLAVFYSTDHEHSYYVHSYEIELEYGTKCMTSMHGSMHAETSTHVDMCADTHLHTFPIEINGTSILGEGKENTVL